MTFREFVPHNTGFSIVAIPREALFLAGKVFLQYRRSGGTRTEVLPDFFIGARTFLVANFSRRSGRAC
jgi:hypothetical protein